MINAETLALIKEFEGLELDAYIDAVGVWTIGYGTTAAAGVGISPKRGMRITEAEAEEYLRRGIDKFATQIRPYFTREPNANQFGAFVSLAYNIGPSAFRGSSALRKFNAGDLAGAADAILLWNKGTVNGKKVMLRGLVRRREAERAMFLKPTKAAPATAPTTTPRPSFWAVFAEAIANLIRR